MLSIWSRNKCYTFLKLLYYYRKSVNMGKYAFLLLVLINFVSSEVPSAAEYERAKEALKDVLPRGADLPRAVRLG